MKDHSPFYHYKSNVLPPHPGKKRLLSPPLFNPCHLLRTRENTDAAADFRPTAPPPQLRFDRSFAWSPLSPFQPIVDTTNASLRISVLNRLCSKLIASITWVDPITSAINAALRNQPAPFRVRLPQKPLGQRLQSIFETSPADTPRPGIPPTRNTVRLPAVKLFHFHPPKAHPTPATAQKSRPPRGSSTVADPPTPHKQTQPALSGKTYLINVSGKDKKLVEALGFGGRFSGSRSQPLDEAGLPPGWGVIPQPRRNFPRLATLNKIGCSNSYCLDLC